MTDSTQDLRLDAALDEWRKALGHAHVVTDRAELARAETTTFRSERRVRGIVRPASRAEVQAVVRIASARKVAVYPISQGKNWGFGSRVPTVDDAVILDLGRMNRIVQLDEELAFVTVEPGVTFGELHAELSARGSRLFASSIGATPEASVLANALERGDGSGPYGDRANHVCGLEVVLATGECIRTGFSRFEATPLGTLHRYGVGPALDGLFMQSNFGVVTELTVWLAPLPRAAGFVTLRVIDPARLPEVIDAIRQLRLEGTLRSVVSLWNDYRVLSTLDRTPGQAPLTREQIGATWFGFATVYAATQEQARADTAHVRAVLGPVADEVAVEIGIGEGRSGAEISIGGAPSYDYAQGIPHRRSLASLYWKKPMKVPDDPDPDRDRCGAIWACPALPLRGEDVARAVAISERVMPRHGFDPLLVIQAVTERVAYFVPIIVYDRDVTDADERAMACHDALLTELGGAGYLPYRLGIQSMGALPVARGDYASVMQRLKASLDPEGILAPGRYAVGGTRAKPR